ncbi:hypothetical protein F4781DRAFT_427545 [Annulohypoxylon bovei var. microspora]|nr:hypothetical protein F4781DRAFT_427545 [Annulohypoxylon bovei var. microspora]
MDAPITSPSMAQCQFSSTTTAKASTSQSFAQPPPATQKTPSTDAFIRDLNLVAEAAKRAQMALLMRDLDGIAISRRPMSPNEVNSNRVSARKQDNS